MKSYSTNINKQFLQHDRCTWVSVRGGVCIKKTFIEKDKGGHVCVSAPVMNVQTSVSDPYAGKVA